MCARRLIGLLHLESAVISNVQITSCTLEIMLWLRKPAHMMVYAGLGLLLWRTCSIFKFCASEKLIWMTLAFCIICAISDEVHQAFAGDRTPLATDVLIDVVASGTAIGLCWLKDRKQPITHSQ